MCLQAAHGLKPNQAREGKPRQGSGHTIRSERRPDAPHVRRVIEMAFDRADEADLVERLRDSGTVRLSLVAEDENGAIVGHILFSPVTVDGHLTGGGLAPLSVLPDHQRKGIGSALIEHGLQILRDHGCPFVIVLGHPRYYPRFGFERASAHGLTSQWPGIRDEAFMVRVLDPRAMVGVVGVARYVADFDRFA